MAGLQPKNEIICNFDVFCSRANVHDRQYGLFTRLYMENTRQRNG